MESKKRSGIYNADRSKKDLSQAFEDISVSLRKNKRLEIINEKRQQSRQQEMETMMDSANENPELSKKLNTEEVYFDLGF